jgi:hypothetical protein
MATPYRTIGSLGKGRYSASAPTESDYTLSPVEFSRPLDGKPSQNGRRIIVWCHGAGSTYTPGPVEKYIANSVGPMVLTDLGGTLTWGNDASMSRITDAWSWGQTRFPNARTDKMVLWGGSMGSLTALLYTLNNAATVAACGVALPIVDPEDVRINNRGGYQSAIEAQYGVGTPVPDAKRPIQNIATFPNVPIAMWGSTDDTIGQYALAQTFDNALTNATLTSMGAQGHGYLTIADNAGLQSWLGQYV